MTTPRRVGLLRPSTPTARGRGVPRGVAKWAGRVRALSRLGRWAAVSAVAFGALTACVADSSTERSAVAGYRNDARPDARTDTRGPAEPVDNDRRARVRLELASLYFSRGQNDTALSEVNQALAAKPDLAEAYALRGLIQGNLGEPQSADESFQRALQLKPQDGDSLHNYGWFLCQQRRFAEADQRFLQALAAPRYRDQVRSLLAQGLCQARAGRLPEAERTLLRSYELDPANPSTAVSLTEVLYRSGDYERARFYIRRVNNQPERSNAQTLWLAARIEHKLANAGGVDTFGRELRSRFPQAPETLAFEQGRFDE